MYTMLRRKDRGSKKSTEVHGDGERATGACWYEKPDMSNRTTRYSEI